MRRPAVILAAVATIAFLLQGTASDRWLPTEWICLVPPPAWLAALLAGIGFSRLPRRAAIPTMAGAVVVALPALLQYQPNLLRLGGDAPPGGLKIVAWNVKSYRGGEKRIAAELAEADADVVCITEGTYRRKPPEFIVRAFPRDYHWVATYQLVVGSRFPIIESQDLPMQSRLRVFRAVVEAPGGRMAVLLADFPRPPRLDTNAMADELWAAVEMEKLPCIVLGDFNTPRGSAQIRRAVHDMADVYATAPVFDRWLASWPSPLPVVQIDQAFASQGWRVLEARVVSGPLSPHCRQEFRVAR